MRLSAKLFAALAITVLAVFPLAAHADLTGDTIHGVYLFPDTSTTFQDLGDFTPPGSGNAFEQLDWSVTGSQITITSLVNTNFTPASFNGFEFDDISRDPLISGVTVDPSSTFLGGVVSFTGSTFMVSFEGLPISEGQFVTYDLSFSAAQTPEPSTFVMLGTGIVGLAGMARRKFLPRS
jgi:PEP-CTERM motif